MKVVKTGGLTFDDLEVKGLIEHDSLQCGVAYFPPRCMLPKEGTTRHDAEEFSFILEGGLRILSGGETHEVGAGDLIHIPRGEEHRSATLGDTACRLVWFLVG